MRLRLFRRSGSEAHRSRMAAERERVQRNMMGRTPDAPARDQPWWKEILGIGTKREWILVGVGLLFFLGYAYEQGGPWKAGWVAITTAAGMLIGGWLKRSRERQAEDERKPVLGIPDSKRDEYGRRG